jgi:hypothetical protein
VVDGGYYEGSGLLTLIQIWLAVEQMVQDHNLDSTAATRIVPWIVVADNHYRSFRTAGPTRRTPETVIPLAAFLANDTLKPSALEQLAQIHTIKWSVPGCIAPSSKAELEPSPSQCGGLVVVAPIQRPSISAPLGWVLSDVSRRDLDVQLSSQLDQPRIAALIQHIGDRNSLPAAADNS